jgi:tetratricopeptide (TPR) repeat protein
MPATRTNLQRNGAHFFGAAFGVALLLTAAAGAQQTRAQGLHFPGFSPPSRNDTRAQPRYQPRSEAVARPAPALDPEDVPINMTKPDRPRPKGSDARVCANQEKDLAVYRIQSCGAIIASGKLKGEALGVAYELRGLAHLDRDDVPHAIGDLNRAIELAPEFAPAYQNRGNAWYARGNFGQALADYDKAIALDPNSASPYINRAAVRRDLGYRDGALEDYARAIELRPAHAPTYNGRGQLYMARKDYARATADFDRAIQYDPSADNYMLRASAREAAGDLDGAIRNFQQAAKLDPKNVAPLNAMASVLYQKKDYDQQIAVLTHAVPLDEKPALSYRLRAEAWLAKGERKKAYADVARALQYAWSVNGLRVRGQMRLADGDADGALADAESMLKIENNNADAIALRGLSYARKKDYAKALPDLNKTIETDANNALAYAERGQAYIAQNDNTHALTDLSRAIDLKLPSAAPYRARAAIYKSKGDTAKALADLTQAIALDPNNAQTYYLTGQVREQTGDIAKAVADYKLALARDGKLNDARLALAAIEERRASEADAKKAGLKNAKPGKPTRLAKSEPGEAVVAPIPESKPEAKADQAPEVTGTIPEPAAKPAGRAKPETKREAKHESKRERALRETKERKEATRKANESRQHSQRAQAPQRELRDLTPAEKRRLYFQALDQKNRAAPRRTGREARFTDAFR